MWGLRLLLRLLRCIRRFIPTHVGFTSFPPLTSSASAVHPHACGVYITTFASRIPYRGSSPRMWGLRSCRRTRQGRCTVHPHAYGVYPVMASTATVICGSSPRMWGLLLPARVRPLSRRFIPTHVGFTTPPFKFTILMTVHPHACGVYASLRRILWKLFGSSPRMWGLPMPDCREISRRTVHPHACGVYD